jgi:localization factor PodJL
MKFGVPWRVKGIRPDARETAREAARRAGMSVGEWLNTVIIDSADEEGIRAGRRAYAEDEADEDELFGVHERLDELTRQLERLNRPPAPREAPGYARPAHGPAAYAPPSYAPPSYAPDRDHLAEAIARLDRRLDEMVQSSRATAAPPSFAYAPSADPRQTAPADAWAPGIDQAIAEITARQQALDADPNAPIAPRAPAAPARPQAPAVPPAQNLSGLEQHLRHITSQIESLRQQPQLGEGIAALRQALGEIARTLMDAMPRRAIEALEGEVHALAGRLDNSRHAGVDASTLATVERGLAEVRDTLRTLTPAENLDGFRDAVRSLAQKVDQLGASGPDANAYQQLEAAIATLRGIVSHVASNEALAHLASEVHALAVKVDQVASAGAGGHGNALEVLEQRVARIAEALESRAQNGGSVPPQLEAVIAGLSDKIERIQHSRGDDVAFVNLEDRIVKLVEKLDASGARFSQLEAIERGLADLLVHIEGQRAAGGAPGVPVDGLQRDLARTQTSLEAVHGTLGHVVDRLAMLESDMRGSRPQSQMPPAAQFESPLPAAPARIFAPAPVPAAEPSPPPSRATAAAQAAAAMARANPKSGRAPIDPNLPPDQPLEPGVNAGRGRLTASPADRIAASEAALGRAKPPVIPDPAGKSNFIAAARRAAKAAVADPSPADLRAAATQEEPSEETGGKTLTQRLRSLFVGASVILLVGGGLRLAANMIESSETPSIPDVAGKPAPQLAETKLPTREARPVTPATPSLAASERENPSFSPDVTGTVRPQASQAQTPPPALSLPALPGSRTPPRADKLPAAIAGTTLRAAVAAGNMAAEYEVGVRYAEGRGVAANSTEAARWFELAARQGLAMAQFRLAGLYEKGVGVKKDTETARRLYKAAAEQGNAQAMHNLAVLYAEGAAVKPDYRTAAQWFRLAADHGAADSQYNLAILYARGIGVDQNLSKSYKWFALAANQGDEDAAKKCDEVAKRLDPAALETARLAVQAFVPQPQPEAATRVKEPAGGWDAASSTAGDPAPKPKRAGPVRVGSR